MKNNWPTKKLGEVLELCDAGTWGEEDPSGMPLLRSSNMQNGRLILDDLKHIDVPKNKKEYYTLIEGDILITKSSGSVDHIGKSLYITNEMDGIYGFSNFTQRLRVNRGLVDPKWVYLKISNPSTRSFLLGASQTTTGLRNLKISALKELKIPLPPLEIQKKIVKKIEELFAKIDQAQSLRESVTKDINSFIAASIHQALKKMPVWQEKRFGDVMEVVTKRTTKTDLPYVGMEDVSAGGTAEFYGSLKPQAVKSMTFHFDHSNVLYGKLRPYLNKILVPQFEGHCTTEFLPLRPNGKLLTREWLALWLRSQETVNKIMTTTTGTRMPRADMKRVKDFIIPLPPIVEQKKIVAQLDALTQKVRELQTLQSQTASDLTALKQSILHQAFQGKLVN